MRAQVKIVIKVFKPKVSGVNMRILDVSLDHLAVSPPKLVGGFNAFQKYWSNWIISPSRGGSVTTYIAPKSV